MAVFQCKMCGGQLDVQDGVNIAFCQYCGTKQTIPKLGNDKIDKILERANTYRLNGEYDKAIDEYQKILDAEDIIDPEIYWNVVLCKYGVVYVDDEASGKKVPTVNRTQMTSVLIDEDYKKTIELADPTTRQLYEEEAKLIDNIQQGILAISRNEDPFDVFICYKETDDNGERTRDSVNAYELYNILNEEGYKTFFARVTLEDKIGKYEPYIFAALNTAKIMIILGSKREYFEAPWVKNEWMRYINLIKKDPSVKRSIIPCYRDMDPYDLPPEFRYYQAQDMTKIGFAQDLIRGIKKVIPKNEASSNSGFSGQGNVSNDINQAQQLIKKAKLYVEQRDYISANKNIDAAFELDPENWEIYLLKLLMEYNLGSESELKDLSNTFENSYNYKKIIDFANEATAKRIKGYNDYIIERLAQENADQLYRNAETLLQFKNDNAKLNDARNLYLKIPNYKDAGDKTRRCIESIYRNITNQLDNATSADELYVAKDELDYIRYDMDVDGVADEIEKKIIYLKAKAVYDSPFATSQAIDESAHSLNEIRDFEGVSELIYNLQTKKIAVERNIKKAKRISFFTAFAAVFGVCVALMAGAIINSFMSNGYGTEKVTDQNNPNKGLSLTYYKIKGVKMQEGSVDGIPIINGYVAKNMWEVKSGNYYYRDENGKIVRDEEVKIAGEYYQFDQSGSMVYDTEYNGKYYGPKGAMVHDRIQEIDGKKYYIDSEGHVLRDSGKKKIGNKEYTFADDGSVLANEWVKENGNYVYYNGDGEKIKNNNLEINNNWYSFDKDGYMETNMWKNYSNGKCYIKSDGTFARSEVVSIDGKSYYFASNTYLAAGIGHMDGYALNGDGTLYSGNVNGVYYVNGKPANGQYNGKYYSNGVFAKNSWAGDFWLGADGNPVYNQWVDNKRYYVGSDGKYVRNTVVDGKFIGDDGLVSSTNVSESNEDAGIVVILGNAQTDDVKGCRITWNSIKQVNATKAEREEVVDTIHDLLLQAEEEVLEYFYNLAEDEYTPKEITMSKISVPSCTKKAATVRIVFSVKKQNGKMLSDKNIRINIDIEGNMYEIRTPDLELG